MILRKNLTMFAFAAVSIMSVVGLLWAQKVFADASSHLINVASKHNIVQVVDMASSTGEYDITLPSTSGNDGMLYTVKVTNDPSFYYVVSFAAEGDSIDGDVEALSNSNNAINNHGWVTFVADASTHTWWMINHVNNY